jgi:hypothetical protein
MKKSLLVISTILVFGITVMGCATKSDLAKMQAQEQQTNLKADQALKASEEANENATKASEAVKAAEERAQAAEERANIAEANAAKANVAFKASMKK